MNWNKTKQLNGRDGLKIRLHEIFKDFMSELPLLQRGVANLKKQLNIGVEDNITTEYYPSKYDAAVKINAFINNVGAELPNGAYILQDVNFYLPLSPQTYGGKFPTYAKRPKIMAVKSLKYPQGEAGGNYSNIDDMIKLVFTNRTNMEILASFLHEWGHWATEGDTRIPGAPNSNFSQIPFFGGYLKNLSWNGEWSDVSSKTLRKFVTDIAADKTMRNAHSNVAGGDVIQPMGVLGEYAKVSFRHVIMEVVVRTRVNVALWDDFRSIYDLWVPPVWVSGKYVNTIWEAGYTIDFIAETFTPEFLDVIRFWCWPPLKISALMEGNKLALPIKNTTAILSRFATREVNLTSKTLSGTAGMDYLADLHMNHGSYTTQAVELVYDDIRRFNKGGDITSDNFNYDLFHSNILWWIDSLFGCESDWNAQASNKTTTACGLGQFTKASIPTAIKRYKNHIDRWNDRYGARNWVPYSDSKKEYPDWLDNSFPNHKEYIDFLTYDQMSALTIVHAHSAQTNDFDWIKLQGADSDAAKRIYSVGHHTKPDTATLARMEKFWKVEQIRAEHLLSGAAAKKVSATCDLVNHNTNVDEVLNALYSKVNITGGEGMFKYYKESLKWLDIEDATKEWISNADHSLGKVVVDVSDIVAPELTKTVGAPGGAPGSELQMLDFSKVHSYPDMIQNVINPQFPVKVFNYNNGAVIGVYRSGLETIIKNNLRDALLEGHHDKTINLLELKNSIESWTNTIPVNVFVGDYWFVDGSPDYIDSAMENIIKGDNITGILEGHRLDAAGVLQATVTAASAVTGGDNNPNFIRFSLAVPRTNSGHLRTLLHEVMHFIHLPDNWGAPDDILEGMNGGTQTLLTRATMSRLRTMWTHRINGIYGRLKQHYQSSPPIQNGELPVYMKYLSAMDLYSHHTSNLREDEFLSRVYSIMAINRCLTFADIASEINTYNWIENSIAITITADEIDLVDFEMREVMKLNKRTY